MTRSFCDIAIASDAIGAMKRARARGRRAFAPCDGVVGGTLGAHAEQAGWVRPEASS